MGWILLWSFRFRFICTLQKQLPHPLTTVLHFQSTLDVQIYLKVRATQVKLNLLNFKCITKVPVLTWPEDYNIFTPSKQRKTCNATQPCSQSLFKFPSPRFPAPIQEKERKETLGTSLYATFIRHMQLNTSYPLPATRGKLTPVITLKTKVLDEVILLTSPFGPDEDAELGLSSTHFAHLHSWHTLVEYLTQNHFSKALNSFFDTPERTNAGLKAIISCYFRSEKKCLVVFLTFYHQRYAGLGFQNDITITSFANRNSLKTLTKCPQVPLNNMASQSLVG